MAHDHFGRQLWISFGIIAVSIILAGGGLYFFGSDLSANADSIMLARTTLNDQDAAVTNLADLKRQGVQAAPYQAAIDQLVPGQYGLVPFSQWFAQEGTVYSVSANASFQGAAVPSAGAVPGTVAFSFTVTGSLSDVVSFFEFISTKSSGFLVAFNSFNVTNDGTGYTASGNGVVFSQ